MITTPTPCDLTVNLFKYTGRGLTLHQYAVTFTPEIMRRNIFSKFLQMVESNGFKEPYAFDGSAILVSTKKFADTVLKAPMREGTLECRIEHKHSFQSDGKSADSVGLMQCMEIISRFYQKIKFCVDGKKMFIPGASPFDIGCGLEVISGLSSSIKLKKDGFYLNLDAAFGVFYRDSSLLDLLVEFAKSKGGRQDPLRDEMGADFYYEFERLVKNVQMTTVHREKNSTFKVSGLLLTPASAVEFEIEGKKWTVASYFASIYKPLRYPHLPLVVVKKKSITIHLPIEVLHVATQKYARKLDEHMTAQMIKVAACQPRQRFQLIEEKARALSAFNNATLNEFGMAFDNRMINCKGTILPPPGIMFADNKKVSVSNGGWNLIGARAVLGQQVQDWKIFTFSSSNRVRDDSINTFTGLAAKYGVSFSPRPQQIVVRNIEEFFGAPKAKLNLIVLPDKNAQRYEEVKRISETYQGVYTQCMVASNLAKLTNPSFVSNLLLKINVKLGGKNWGIDKKLLSEKPTMLIGIDVNHPGIGDLSGPSIASVVATMDYDFIGYRTLIDEQPRGQEIVGTLKENIKTMLKGHYGCTSTKPARLLIFRDGVGESMFNAVYNCEIEAIEQACKELDANYQPEINFVIAQKRHSIRFKAGDRNAMPGTVVDEIGEPGVFDFYLVSHNAIQGTARPVRYVVFRNDSKFTSTQMHETTYALCHLYARATKAVSVVPPIYYADLAAARGRCYLEKNKDGAVVMRPCNKEIQKSLFYL